MLDRALASLPGGTGFEPETWGGRRRGGGDGTSNRVLGFSGIVRGILRGGYVSTGYI